MKHENLDMPKTYKTFEELAEYARQRAQISANRRGHQEFAYWFDIMGWAKVEAFNKANPAVSLQESLECLENFMDWVNSLGDQTDPNSYDEHSHRMKWMAHWYAHAVHCRIMLINRGEKPPRLSLNWLRKAAGKL